MGSSTTSRKGAILKLGTVISLFLTCRPGAGAVPDGRNGAPVETIDALLGQNVTIPCLLSVNGVKELDLKTVSVRWTLTTANGTEVSVYRYDWLKHDSNRQGSKIEDSDLRKGNASLCIPYVQLSDEGKYKCIIIATPDKSEATSTVQVSAQPACALSDSELVVITGAERSVTCYVRHYYPGPVDVHWVKYSKVSSQPYKLDTCSTAQVLNTDGTFNVTNKLSVKPTSLHEDGDIYSCIVTHRSLSSDLNVNITLSVQEQETFYQRVLVICIPIILLIILFFSAVILFLWYKKDPPEVPNIAETELIDLVHMKTKSLPCHISGFRPNALDIRIYLQRVTDENRREIYTWNSKSSKRDSHRAGDDHIPLLESGSTDNRPLQVAMEAVMTLTKRTMLFPYFSYDCTIYIMPIYGIDDGALLVLEVKHAALNEPICRQVQLKVEGAPPTISSIKAPQYLRHDEHVTLTCNMTKFYPDQLLVTWVKEYLLKHEPPLVIYDSVETFDRKKYEVTTESVEETAHSCSSSSTLGFVVDVTSDHAVRYSCRAKHPATNQIVQSDIEMHVTAVPMMDPIQSDLTCYSAGHEMELSCRIHSFHPQHLQVKWYKEDEVLSSTELGAAKDDRGLFYGTCSVTYTIRLEDFGKIFRCEVDHQSSCPQSVEWKLEEAGA